MCKQRVSTIEDVGDGVDLVLSERDFRVDADKVEMAAVILTGANAVEFLVIELRQFFAPFRITPNPFRKCALDELLLALCNGRFLLVEDGGLLTVGVFNVIKDTDITEVQRFLDDLVAVDARRAVGAVCLDVAPVIAFALHIPFAGVFRVMDFDVPLAIVGRREQAEHELRHDLRWQPCCTQTNGNLTG